MTHMVHRLPASRLIPDSAETLLFTPVFHAPAHIYVHTLAVLCVIQASPCLCICTARGQHLLDVTLLKRRVS